MTLDSTGIPIPGTLGDFTRLTVLACQLSEESAGQVPHAREIEYGSNVFTTICLTAHAILQTHPESGTSVGGLPRIWNPVATASLARVLMEACVNLYYFCVEEIEEEEREFRFLVADLHCARERLHMSDSIRAECDRFRRVVDQPTDAQTLHLAERSNVARSGLEDSLRSLARRLQANGHFCCLSGKERKMWYEGDYSGEGRYRGRGFHLELRERARRACFAASAYEAQYRYLSSYVHSAPSAIDQIAAVGQDPAGMRDEVIPSLIRQCCGLLAIAIRYFLSLVPDCSRLISTEAVALIDVCTSYVIGPVWLLAAESGEDAAK